MAFGFWTFYHQNQSLGVGIFLSILNLIAFFGLLLVFEFFHRRRMARTDPFTKVQASMTEAEFNRLVSQGRKLVILDEFVVDVQKYIDWHPGGKFLLSHNIGRDVSKFFHGGYALEGNLGRLPAPGWKHSNLSRQVVNLLIVARF